MLPRLMLQWRRAATPLALALVSVIVAIALWIAVTEAENPTKVTVFSGSIEVRALNVPEGLGVYTIRDPATGSSANVVNFRISAPEDTLKRLTADDFRAEIDLAGEHRATSEQRIVGRVVGNRDVDIVEVQPPVVTVVLEPLSSKVVPVQPNKIGAPPQGYSVQEQSLEASPAQVKVTGAESLVRLVSYASADVNLTGLRVSIRQQYPLVPKDALGGEVTRVRLEPTSAEIRVPVSQQEVTLALTIAVSTQGIVAGGYNLVAINPDPPAVSVSGPLEVLQAQSSIQTEPIDVTGIRADATRTVRLRLPAGVQSARDSVTVRLKVVPAQGEITMSVSPQLTNTPEGLRAVLQSPILTLRLSGELPTLSGLSPSSLRATVNLSGLSEGVHVLKPSISPPEGVQVVSVDPAQVTVSLQK